MNNMCDDVLIQNQTAIFGSHQMSNKIYLDRFGHSSFLLAFCCTPTAVFRMIRV